MATTTLEVSGMRCASCARRVEAALRKVPGVTEVAVDLDTGRARVHHDPDLATVERLVQSVVTAGHSSRAA
jgi:copper chaperone CopZ